MVTQHDKAIVALIMTGIQLLNSFGFHIGLDETTVTAAVAILTPVVVWFTPNKA